MSGSRKYPCRGTAKKQTLFPSGILSGRPNHNYSHRLVVVSRRPVRARNRHIVHAQVNTQLRAVMNDVVQDHAFEHANARHSEHGVAAGEQRPRCRQSFVTRARYHFLRRRNVLVEGGEQPYDTSGLSAPFCGRWAPLPATAAFASGGASGLPSSRRSIFVKRLLILRAEVWTCSTSR